MANTMKAHIDRVLQLWRLLSATDGSTVDEVCARLGIGRSTFYRNMRLLEKAGVKVDAVPDPSNGRRRLYRLRTPELDLANPATAAILAAASRALAAFEETDGYKAVLRALSGTTAPYEIVWSSRSKPPDRAILSTLDSALRRERSLEIRYGSEGASLREVDPLRLIVHDGTIYLHAWDSEAEEGRLFRASKVLVARVGRHRRMEPARVPMPPIAGSAWVGEPFEFELVFRSDAADDARHYEFGSPQEEILQTDGSLVVRGSATGLLPLLSAVLSWGAKVCVRSPQELVSAWRGEIEQMAAAVEDPSH